MPDLLFRALLARIGSKLTVEQLKRVRFIYDLRRDGALDWYDIFHELQDRDYLLDAKSVREMIDHVCNAKEKREWMEGVRKYELAVGASAVTTGWLKSRTVRLRLSLIVLLAVIAGAMINRQYDFVELRGQIVLSLPLFGAINLNIQGSATRYRTWPLMESHDYTGQSCTDDEQCMQLAIVASQRSPDPHHKVGAVIVSSTGEVLSSGCNRMPGNKDFTWNRNGSNLAETKHGYVVHAIEDAVFSGYGNMFATLYNGSRVYTTLFPGHRSAQTVTQLGMKEVVYLQNMYSDRDYTIAGQNILEKNQILHRQLHF